MIDAEGMWILMLYIPGPAKFSAAEEEELAHFPLKCADIGYGHSNKQVLPIIQRVVDSKEIHAVVTNGWWEKRFQLSTPASQLTRARALASDCASVDKYFDLLEKRLVKNGMYF